MERIPYWRQIFDQGVVTKDVIDYPYPGSGTEDDPYAVSWIPNDPRNPLLFAEGKKWGIALVVSVATLAVALISSAYTGGSQQILVEFHSNPTVVTLGVSLFVLGFAIGPLIWAPMSELYGRQVLFFGTYAALTAFNAGAAGSKNMATLIVLRFFAGAFGSSPLTNAGGIIADMFPAAQRGMAMGIFALAPFLGPILGPIIGGFLGMTRGWRWVEGFLAIFSGALWIIGSILVPETYAPVLLRKRAERLSKLSGKVYRSRLVIDQGHVTVREAFVTALKRPWILLFYEPIVLLLSIYMSIVYGTLYMLFAAFPIVFQQERGWNEGVGGLSFLGVLVGMLIAFTVSSFDNKRYVRVAKKHGGFAPPETRLPVTILGGIAIPIGLFWFAWTSYPWIHWFPSVAAGAPFGFGMVLVFLGLMNYLIDAYTIYAASVLAASAVLRSLFGAAFPLFTRQMYDNLGVQWASSIPAFLSLVCVPFPFLFYKYGATIRRKCRFAAEADDFMRKIVQQQAEKAPAEEGEELESDIEMQQRPESAIYEDVEQSEPSRTTTEVDRHTLRRASTVRSRVGISEYEGNPFDVRPIPLTTRWWLG
jgi:multidrug resistance protein